MASDIRNLTVKGRLTRDADVKSFEGSDVIRFSIASNRSVKREGQWTEEPTFFTVEYWRKSGSGGSLAQYLTKGTPVVISGDVYMESYTASDGQQKQALKVRALEVNLCGSPQGNGNGQQTNGQQGGYGHQQGTANGGQHVRQATATVGDDFEDDIPF